VGVSEVEGGREHARPERLAANDAIAARSSHRNRIRDGDTRAVRSDETETPDIVPRL